MTKKINWGNAVAVSVLVLLATMFVMKVIPSASQRPELAAATIYFLTFVTLQKLGLEP